MLRLSWLTDQSHMSAAMGTIRRDEEDTSNETDVSGWIERQYPFDFDKTAILLWQQNESDVQCQSLQEKADIKG